MTPRPGETAAEIAARYNAKLGDGVRVRRFPAGYAMFDEPTPFMGMTFGSAASARMSDRAKAYRARLTAARLRRMDEHADAMRRLCAEGLTDLAIGKRLGVSESTIAKWRADLGIIKGAAQ